MKLAIVGAQGALGYSAVAAAVGGGARAIVRRPRPGFFDPAVEVVACDAGETAALTRALDGCGALLFCVNVPIATWAAMMPRLLDSAIAACQATGARLVFPGNVWIYGPGPRGTLVDESRPPSPTSRKGKLRVALETRLRGAGVRYAIVRLPEFYGPNVANRLMGRPFLDAIAGRPITWYGGNLDVTVEYVFIPDGARAMVEVARGEGVDGETFHVPGAAPTTPRAFFGAVARGVGGGPRVRALPPLLLRAAGLVDGDARAFADILHLWTDPVLLDGSKFRRRFGAVPATPYQDGIAQTLTWFRAHPDAENAN